MQGSCEHKNILQNGVEVSVIGQIMNVRSFEIRKYFGELRD